MCIFQILKYFNDKYAVNIQMPLTIFHYASKAIAEMVSQVGEAKI